MILLSVVNLSAGYGGEPVVNGISFDIAAGEITALLGLNGSGKTTLLKAVCGLLPAAGGQYLAEGRDITRLHEYRRARHIAYLPQRHSELEGVTVLDAVLMGCHARLGALAFPSAADRARALDALRRMGCESLRETDFSRLSEGQKQLVLLARTLVQDTKILLMDEPDSMLDFLNRHKTLDILRRLIRKENKAGLVTLHDPNLALAYCDRLLLLRGGVIISDTPVAGLNREDLRACLSAVYGDVTIAEHAGRWIVLAPGT